VSTSLTICKASLSHSANAAGERSLGNYPQLWERFTWMGPVAPDAPNGEYLPADVPHKVSSYVVTIECNKCQCKVQGMICSEQHVTQAAPKNLHDYQCPACSSQAASACAAAAPGMTGWRSSGPMPYYRLPCRVRHVLEIQARNLTDGFTKCPVCESHARQSYICHSVGRSFALGPQWANSTHSTSPRTVVLGKGQRWVWGCTCGNRWAVLPDSRSHRPTPGCSLRDCTDKTGVGFDQGEGFG